MQPDASEFVRALSSDGDAVGFIPGGSLVKVLQAWEALHGSQGILRVRLPYEPGRKDRQLAGVLLAALGQPALTRSVPTARAWELVARGCRERGCKLVVVENADLLDRESLVYASRRYLPGVVLVGGERLGQQIARSAAYPGRILGWAAA